MALAARTLDARGMADALVTIAGRGQLHFDAMRAAIDIIRASIDPAAFETRLRDEPAPDLRRLALEALAAAAAPERGWTPSAAPDCASIAAIRPSSSPPPPSSSSPPTRRLD